MAALRTGKYLEDIGHGVRVYYSTALKAKEAYELIEERKEMLSDTIVKRSFQGSLVSRLIVHADGTFSVSRCDIWYPEKIATFKKRGTVQINGEEVEVFGQSNLSELRTLAEAQDNMEKIEDKARDLLNNCNGAVTRLKVYSTGRIEVHTDWVGYWYTAVHEDEAEGYDD